MAVKVNGGFSGKVKLFDKMIAYNWKGLQVFRSEAPKIHQTPSTFRNNIKQVLTNSADRWSNVLTNLQRQEWESFAASQNREAREISNRIGAGAKNIIRSRQKLFSGINAYIRSNILAFTRNLPFPRDNAPLNLPTPQSPSIALVSQTGGLNIEVRNPSDVSGFGFVTVTFAVFIAVQKIKRIHTQIAGLLTVPANDTTPHTITITTIRVKQDNIITTVPLSKFNTGEAFIQADIVPEPTDTALGYFVSAPSNLLTIKLNIS